MNLFQLQSFLSIYTDLQVPGWDLRKLYTGSLACMFPLSQRCAIDFPVCFIKDHWANLFAMKHHKLWWLDSDGDYFCGEPVHLLEPGGYVNSNNSARTHLCFTMFDFASIEVIRLPKAQGRVTFCHAQKDSLTEMMNKTTIKIVLQFPTDIARYSTRPMLHIGVWQKRTENQTENQTLEQSVI